MPANAEGAAAVPQPVRADLQSRAGLAVLALAAAALTVVALAHLPAGEATARALGVALPVGFGLLRLAREPEDRFARLLIAAGALCSLTTLAASTDGTLYSVGRVSVWLIEPLLVFLILAFPHGRVETRGGRRLTIAVVAVVATLYLPTALLAPFPAPSPWAGCGSSCPANAFQAGTATAGAVDDFILPARELLTVALFALVTVAVVRRARSAGPMLARTLTPVAAVAAVRTLALAVYVVERGRGDTSTAADALGWMYVLSLPLITASFAGGLLAHRLFVAGALERLTGHLSSHPSAREVRATLAEALRDPELDLRFAVRESPSEWVDSGGRPAAPPQPSRTRAVTELSTDGRRLAVIVHDRELGRDRALVAAVSAYTGTALENRQLIGDLRASLSDLTRSRARLVTAADQERRKIERDLHDGAQQRLIALEIKLELLAEELESHAPAEAGRVRALEHEVEETLDEVRRFGRGLYPPLLADRGLRDALQAVARRAPTPTTIDSRLTRRYPRAVESAVYFACIEALQNAAKHAGDATSVSIALSGNGRLRFEVHDNGAGFDTSTATEGAGLTHMRDRIGALGGDVVVTSRPGRGTRVTGTVPVPERSASSTP